MKKPTSKKTRQGSHKEGDVRFGMYCDPFIKAVATLSAKIHTNCKLNKLVERTIINQGIADGILEPDTHKPTEQYREQLAMAIEVIRQSSGVNS